jgi:hypothetical protein
MAPQEEVAGLGANQRALSLRSLDPDHILDRVLMATGGFVRDFDPATRVKQHGNRRVHLTETVVNGIAERLGVVHANFEFPETGIPDTSPPLERPEGGPGDPEVIIELTDAYWAWTVATRKDHEFDKGAKRKLRTILEASPSALRTGNTSRFQGSHASKMTYVPDPNASGPPNPDQERVADQVIERVCVLLFESRHERLKALQRPSQGSRRCQRPRSWWPPHP